MESELITPVAKTDLPSLIDATVFARIAESLTPWIVPENTTEPFVLETTFRVSGGLTCGNWILRPKFADKSRSIGAGRLPAPFVN